MNEKNLKKELKSQSIGYLLAAFGLVAGLAWNDAIKSSIEYVFPIDKNGLLPKFIYAAAVTVVVVVVTYYVSKLLSSKEES